MTASAAAAAVPPAAASHPGRSAMLLYGLLGFSAGLPFYMFSTVLALRLQAHGVALTVLGFFAWVQLLPTLKFVWAPLLDKYDVPGFSRFWGKRRGWIMLAQLGIVSAMGAMAWTADDASLPVTALFAVLLAFWTNSRGRSSPPTCGAIAPRWWRRGAGRCCWPTMAAGRSPIC
jgi:PAT family beta-lactamase induction signal transducer AmpG